MTQTFGEVSYDDSYGDKKGGNNKDLFLRLNEGENEIRLLTNPFQYVVHKVQKDPTNPKDFGRKVPCSQMHGECPACSHGKPKTRWLYGVISNGQYKILDVSWAVFSQIKKLAKNPKWGDPTKYNICIIVDKNADPTSYYAVQPIPKEPLSAAEQQVKDRDLDMEDLKRRVTPPEPSVVQKILDKMFGDAETAAAAAATVAPAKKAAVKPVPKAVSMTDDDEVSNDFPDYDNQA